MTDTQKMNIKNMRRQGMGYKRIAGSLGLSENTVKSFCKRNRLDGCAVADVKTAKCKQCGKQLEQTPKARPKIFCCNKCRYDYWNNNPEQRQSARQTVCAGCGKVFACAGSNRKYCGHPCYISNRFKVGGIANDASAI